MCGPTPATSKIELCNVYACVTSCAWLQMKPVIYCVCVCVCVCAWESVSVREYVLSCSPGIYIYIIYIHILYIYIFNEWPTPQLLQLASTNKSCHVYAWVMSYMNENESCDIHVPLLNSCNSHLWISNITCMHMSRHIHQYRWVASHVTYINTDGWVTSHTWIQMAESRHAHEYRWLSHVTYISTDGSLLPLTSMNE